jgi:uncharacterized membrane protein (UPF0127 family)
VPLRVTNLTRGAILADRAEEATGFFPRFIGLMGKKDLPFGQGLHLLPCNSIHTFFMRIPIDALFLDPELKIVRLFNALPPWRVTGLYWSARSVLELPAGTAFASKTAEGDRLEFKTL